MKSNVSKKVSFWRGKTEIKTTHRNWNKNHPTILKFLKPENDAKSNVVTIHSSFDSDTINENLETEIQVNDLDESLLNNYETKLKLIANNSLSINNVLISYSNKIEVSKTPGLWPETIDMRFRKNCIKLGSVFFQNRKRVKNFQLQNVYITLKIVFCPTIYSIKKCVIVI